MKSKPKYPKRTRRLTSGFTVFHKLYRKTSEIKIVRKMIDKILTTPYFDTTQK